MACSSVSLHRHSFQGSFKEPIIAKILTGKSVCNESSSGLSEMIYKIFGTQPQNIDQSELHFSETEIDSGKKILLVFPGARTLSDWNFSVETQHRIKTLFEEGRIKLLCAGAGAYYVSEQILYNKEEKKHEHELRFFKGACIGPAFEGNMPEMGEISVEQVTVAEKVVNVVMSGGGYFVPFQEGEDCKVLARYSSLEEKAAAIACRLDKAGSFSAVLLGAHFEYNLSSEILAALKIIKPSHSKEFEEMSQVLKESKWLRLEAIRSFLSEMGFK